MTSQEAFTPEEWTTIIKRLWLEPRVDFSGKYSSELHPRPSKPVSDRARAHSKEELVTSAVKHLEQAVAIITKKATPPELADYRSFVNSLCAAVAAAHREGDAGVSPEESAVIDQVAAAMGNAT